MYSRPHLLTILTWLACSEIVYASGGDYNGGDHGNFTRPSARIRPRFRYWLPDSSVDLGTLAEDIKSVADVGAGGVEFLPFFSYGGTIGSYPPGADWATYGFGTPHFHEVFRTALEAHEINGLVMDFALGPNQGQGVPAAVTDEGLQWDLIPFSIAISLNEGFDGIIPGWGEGDLIALVTATVISQVNVSLPAGWASGFGSPSQSSYIRLTLKEGSLEDLTNRVSLDGRAHLTFPPLKNATEQRLFAFYQRRSLHKNLEFPNNDSTSSIFSNGSFAVDHFSSRGAETVINFWEKYILRDGIDKLLEKIGNYGWEDSQEILSNISWTPKLPEKFEKKFGYNIFQYLPLIMWGNNNINLQSTSPGLFQAVLDNVEASEKVQNDYRSVLADCYNEYFGTLRAWLNSRLNLQLSAQTSYNLPMDALANIPVADAPECESLQFEDKIDSYRQFSGVAYLAGKRIISNEMGAVMLEAYHQTIPALLLSNNKAFAGGVNQVVLHGYTYSGNYYGTTWPGYTPFQYLFSELHSPKQPSWAHGFDEAIAYISRTQYILQQGVPKIDITFVNKDSVTNPSFRTLYTDDDLSKTGFTYAYLSPDNFKLPSAQVLDGVLGADGPAFKAIAITSNMNITVVAAKQLQKYAAADLPIILVGGIPGHYQSSNEPHDDFGLTIDSLLSMKNVHQAEVGQLSNKLLSIGVRPQITVRTDGAWYPVWREDPETGIDYAFVFADNVTASGTIDVLTTKTPFFLDPWSGEGRPVVHYKREEQSTTIQLELVGNQTVIIAFSNEPLSDIAAPQTYIHEMPSNILGYNFSNEDGLFVKVASASLSTDQQRLVLSNGKETSLVSNIIEPFQLQNWTLIAEHWEAPDSMYEASIIAQKRNTTHNMAALVSWTEIPSLANASGIGYYLTSFTWSSEDDNADGAYIRVSHILHAIQVYVNGKKAPPVDCYSGAIDIGPYLVEGSNEVLIVVPTTMWNYLLSIFDKIMESGSPPLLQTLGASLLGMPGPVSNGLVGDVSILPYRAQYVDT